MSGIKREVGPERRGGVFETVGLYYVSVCRGSILVFGLREHVCMYVYDLMGGGEGGFFSFSFSYFW